MPKEIDEWFSSVMSKQRNASVDDSVLAKLVDIKREPAIMIFGPTKVGKTNLSMWEACSYAKAMNRRILSIYTESNMEGEDFKRLLAMCMYNNVACELVKINHIRGLHYYLDKIVRTLSSAVRQGELETQSRVFIVDSLTAISELIAQTLSEGLFSNPRSLNAYFNIRQMELLDPLRRIVSDQALAGYLIMTAHESKLIETKETLELPVSAKPRYANEARYKEDLEVYMTGDIPKALLTKRVLATKRRNRPLRALIVTSTRRNIDSIGKGIVFYWSKQESTVKGLLEYIDEGSRVVFKYTPEDMLPTEKRDEAEEYTFTTIVPKVIEGPTPI